MKKIGILGGGQLGRMFIQETLNLGIETHILDPDPQAPCRHLADRFVVGSLSDFDTVCEFAQQVDILTIEIENVNTEALFAIQNSGKKVFPQPKAIQIIQDKRKQKLFYQQNNIPTSAFRIVSGKTEIEKNLDFLPAFQKLASGGYDGRGVQRLDSAQDLTKAFDAPSVLEKYVDLEKEISVIAARSPSGQISTFPVVEMVFDPVLNLVDYLRVPAAIPENIKQQATQLAIKVIEKLEMIGILAIEMFLTTQGELLVNEAAPRPHNSGHHTIEANYTSQFAQHLRAILGLPLGSTQARVNSAAMVNLLGASGFEGRAYYKGLEEVLTLEGVFVHLYGKILTKPGRKMGHVTIIHENEQVLMQNIQKVKKTLSVISM
ncbi:MAG: 5-(carboxyamino)imidazole ribonucleotide synthase [Microscillaceae bacterium]|nr:5-(carboxyamino)imidazole ribonucleotide synthase [Microscillaceae bacterium]